jgi:hypothetical protein
MRRIIANNATCGLIEQDGTLEQADSLLFCPDQD